MKCDKAQEYIVLLHYGELPDEFAVGLEQHLGSCEDCHRELNAMQALEEQLALLPIVEPSPNLLAQTRMRPSTPASAKILQSKDICETRTGKTEQLAAVGI